MQYGNSPCCKVYVAGTAPTGPVDAATLVLVIGTTVTGAGVKVKAGMLVPLKGVMNVPLGKVGLAVIGEAVPDVAAAAPGVAVVPLSASAVCVPKSATNCIASTPVGNGDTNKPAGMRVGVAAGAAE